MRQIKVKGAPPPADYDVIPIVRSLQKYGDVILFGSFSRGEKANDLDFFLISDVEEIEIGDFGVRIDIKVCTREKLLKCLGKREHLLKKAWERGIHYLE